MSSTSSSPFREAWAVARFELATSLVSLRALFLILGHGVFAGAAGAILLSVDEKTEGKLRGLFEQARNLSGDERAAMLDQIAQPGVGRHFAEAIMSGALPPFVFFVLLASAFAVPGLVLLVGYNRIADDAATGFMRYVLQRVHRGSYLAGKIAGHFLVAFFAILVSHLVLLAMAFRHPAFEAEATLSAMPRVWLAVACFVLAYASFTAVFSAAARSPFGALIGGASALFALWVAGWIVGPIGQLWMGRWDVELWSLDPMAVLVYLAHAAAFSALAYAALLRRDL